MSRRFPRHVLPGFSLSLGYTVFYLSLVVLIPFAALFIKACSGTWSHFYEVVTDPRVVASYKLSFGLSLVAALINGFFGVLLAWALVRYDFPGRRLADALVDLPFALPTAVAGLSLTAIYAPNGIVGNLFAYDQWLGSWFAPGTALNAWISTTSFATYLGPTSLRISFTSLGILIALTFIGLPFVVRTVQPVIADLSLEYEEAAACLGASRWYTFRKVVLPGLLPSILAGITMAFGRAVGEYGSVVFISGNMPYRTEITPLLIIMKLEEFDYVGAAAIGLVMLIASFGIVLLANAIQSWGARKLGRAS